MINCFNFPHRKGVSQFPKPYRGIERRSVTDEEMFEEDLAKASKWKHSVRAMIARKYKLPSFRSTESDSDTDAEDILIEKPAYDEFTDIASSRTQVEVLDEKKQDFLESWLKRLHFITIPVHQFGNWIPLVTSRWYCSGHGCGLDQISFEGKAGE